MSAETSMFFYDAFRNFLDFSIKYRGLRRTEDQQKGIGSFSG